MEHVSWLAELNNLPIDLLRGTRAILPPPASYACTWKNRARWVSNGGSARRCASCALSFTVSPRQETLPSLHIQLVGCLGALAARSNSPNARSNSRATSFVLMIRARKTRNLEQSG